MNKVILIGRLTADPDSRTTQNTTISRFSLAVDRKFKGNGDQSADFINCVSFGKSAEFVSKYLRKGTKIAVTGRIQTGNYTNKEGKKIYTIDVIVEEIEFAESKKSAAESDQKPEDDFMSIPNGIDDELPFA